MNRENEIKMQASLACVAMEDSCLAYTKANNAMKNIPLGLGRLKHVSEKMMQSNEFERSCALLELCFNNLEIIGCLPEIDIEKYKNVKG